MKKNKLLAVVLAILLSACGGGDSTNAGSAPTFPEMVYNFGNPEFASGDHWRPACNQNVRVALQSHGACWQRCHGRLVDECTWRVDGVNRIVIQTPNSNPGCVFSIREIRSGPSEDVFFGRPAFGIDVEPECEFRRADGPI